MVSQPARTAALRESRFVACAAVKPVGLTVGFAALAVYLVTGSLGGGATAAVSMC
ncbi:MAG: hypothetical protein WCB12_19870 [Bryobacteraceae bacterium]